MSKKLRTWLQLFRAPNLFTVPGDPLAGYVLAAYGAFEPAVWLAVGASVCFYGAGLLDNDLADLREDREERAFRPLPSGAANPRTVAVVAVVLTALGLGLAALLGSTALVIAGALVIAVVLYNHGMKKLPVIGALNMGLCRGLSLLLGAAAAPHHDLLWRLLASGHLNALLAACGLVTLYIAAVTNLARFETKYAAPAYAKWLPAIILAVGAMVFLVQVRTGTNWSAGAFFLLASVSAVGTVISLSRPGTPIPPAIGRFIRLLLLIQGGICGTMGIQRGALGVTDIDLFAIIVTMLRDGLVPTLLAVLLLIAWPISREVSKRFYAS